MIKISIIFPSDPFGIKVGGSESFIHDVIKFAPAEFEIEFIGITIDKKERPVKKWIRCHLGPKELKLYPIYFVKDENKKIGIPLSLPFTFFLALSGIDFRGRILIFNRIEPALALMHMRTPKIGFVHNDIKQQIGTKGSEVLWSKFPWLYFKIEGFIFKSLDRVYTVSRATVEFYRKRYSAQKEKFFFLPTWSDKKIFFPVRENKSSLREEAYFSSRFLPADKKWLLFVGRMQKQKAPLRLIDTFFEYHKKDTDSCLIIIGGGDLRNDVEEYTKRFNLEKNVFFLGSIPKTDLARFYRASDVLVLTSNFEGMPLCILEAMGCGLPVVSTNVGEVSSIVKNNFSGEVVDTFLPNDIAQAIKKVIDHPEVYSRDNCVNTVIPYAPEKVLESFYNQIRQLYYKTYDRQ